MATTDRANISLLDHAGEHVMWLSVNQAQQMLREQRVEIVGTRRKPMRKVRFRMPEPLMHGRRFVIRVKPLGAAHNKERRDNPRGVWTIDPMPRHALKIFRAVVEDCLVVRP